MVYTTPTNHTPLINCNTWYLEILIRKGLGVHGEKRCRARIILILALAMWQDLRGIDNCKDYIVKGLFV